MKIQKFNNTNLATLITDVNNFIAGLTIDPGLIFPFRVNTSYTKRIINNVTTYYAIIAYSKS